jgi:hypothetical protein
MDDDDTMEENTLLNSEEEREMVDFALEASRRVQQEDRERAGRRGESSMSGNMGHGSLAARIKGAPRLGPACSFKACIDGSTEASAKGSHRVRAEDPQRPNPHTHLSFRTPLPDQMPQAVAASM